MPKLQECCATAHVSRSILEDPLKAPSLSNCESLLLE